ncbi:MAG: OmpA family protein [Planctomycetota bacterium]
MDEDEGGGDIPEWVVTFGDMMSLLLTFFIMLVSMSEIKQEEKFQAMLESMRRQFGHESSMSSMVPGMSTPANSSMQSIAALGRAKRKDIVRGGNRVKSPNGEDNLVRTIRPGRDTTVGGVVFFAEDSADLSEEARDQLDQIATQVAGKPQKVEVRGHASRKPVADGDHYTLASRRARAAMAHLVARGIAPERIRLGSAGANEPIDDSYDPSRRAMNARVEVLMWDEKVGGTE